MTSYTLEFTEDPRAFLERAGDFLEADPVVNTVVATNATRAAGDVAAGRPAPTHPRWWVSVVAEDQTVVGAAMRTAPFAPYPLYVLPMPAEATTLLGAALVERGEAEAGANGALPAARLVAENAARGVGGTVEVGRVSRIWVLGDLLLASPPAGRPRIATADDLDLVEQWFHDFHPAAELQAGQPPGNHLETVERADIERRVLEARVWLWLDEDDVPVHLTGFNAPSFGVARIGPVYTPAEHGGRGYAGATVGLVSRMLLDAGARVCLFTDVANPVSTKVYARLGFEAVADTANHQVVV